MGEASNIGVPMRTLDIFCILVSTLLSPAVFAAAGVTNWPGDEMLKPYFESETRNLEEQCLADIKTRADWEGKRGQYREELFEMLGLSPRPPKTEMKPTITGELKGYGVRVEKLHFQSMPGLYVTANFYLPETVTNKIPAILYLCGHGPVVTNGVSVGNKTAYQHHGEWFARNGYACLTLDTIQLGEISGVHHGTYKEGMWWWNSRGYTPAGVEAWNSIRALDYLESRPEVDGGKIGVTGRSGGGAYSWWVAALDDRIRVAAPVAGITDLRNHVVDGVVEGHCDCMFMVNTYRWDYPQVAALVAPRPLLICNSDKDGIFPLDGVSRLHRKVANIYRILDQSSRLGLLITEGPHKDTQDLQVPVFRWFNRWLKNSDTVVEMAAVPLFPRPELRVFSEIPADERTSHIHDTFVPRGSGALNKEELRQKCFRGWPEEGSSKVRLLWSERKQSWEFRVYEIEPQPGVALRMYGFVSSNTTERARLTVLDQSAWPKFMMGFKGADEERLASFAAADPRSFELKEGSGSHFWLAPRGVGMTAWNPDPRHDVQIKRRFMLLGQTLDGMRVYDILCAIRAVKNATQGPITLSAEGKMGVNAIYAALFEPVEELSYVTLPETQEDGPDYLNVLRFTDIPQVLAAVKKR
jgi:hypothetical protein